MRNSRWHGKAATRMYQERSSYNKCAPRMALQYDETYTSSYLEYVHTFESKLNKGIIGITIRHF